MTTTTAPALVAWHKRRLCGFDLETTGVDVFADRVVTAAIVQAGGGQATDTTRWMANPGIDIPTGASDIHGITTERAQAEGREPATVLTEIVDVLAGALSVGTPVIGMNLVYDLTLLESECARHGVTPLSAHTAGFGGVTPIIDVRLLDKQFDRFRRGSRKLVDLCAHYGVRLDQAHDAASDVLGSMRVAYKLAERFPKLQIDPYELHRQQVTWAAIQMRGFAEYRRGTKEYLDDEDGTWPIKHPDGAYRFSPACAAGGPGPWSERCASQTTGCTLPGCSCACHHVPLPVQRGAEQCERAGCDSDDDTTWGLCSACQTADDEERRS